MMVESSVRWELTPEETGELIEHLKTRPDIWLLRKETPGGSAWLRLHEQRAALVMQIANGVGLPDSPLYVLETRAVTWSVEHAQQYTRWLLSKYSSYGWRKKVEQLLSHYGVERIADVAVIARAICQLETASDLNRTASITPPGSSLANDEALAQPVGQSVDNVCSTTGAEGSGQPTLSRNVIPHSPLDFKQRKQSVFLQRLLGKR